jgi:uncharacterized protein
MSGGNTHPRPAVNDDTAFFWEGIAAGELRIQRCADCGVLRHPPSPGCAACGSLAWNHAVAGGRGAVFSYAIVRHPLSPPFTEPYAVVVVELDEGVRFVSRLIDAELERIEIGMTVELELVAVDDTLTLPLFRPARA